MSVYLGSEGAVEFRRTGEPIHCTLKAEDVNAAQNRFSIDFDPSFDGLTVG